MIAETPQPPYYAVIFSTKRTEGDNGYSQMAQKMEALAREQPGYLGVESARAEVIGITVSYWVDEASILAWKKHVEHAAARELGREKWYEYYMLRIAKVERDYGFKR